MHDKVPWIWSDQFDLKLIIIGVGYSCDTTIVRGSPATRIFSICDLRNGRARGSGQAVASANNKAPRAIERLILDAGYFRCTGPRSDLPCLIYLSRSHRILPAGGNERVTRLIYP